MAIQKIRSAAKSFSKGTEKGIGAAAIVSRIKNKIRSLLKAGATLDSGKLAGKIDRYREAITRRSLATGYSERATANA